MKFTKKFVISFSIKKIANILLS